jgi:hypothetical protein
MEQLNIKLLTKHNNGVGLAIEFDNGYGASIVCHDFSYGGPCLEGRAGKDNLYELAVIRDGDLCYDTPITNDVLGWQTMEEVNKILDRIKKL